MAILKCDILEIFHKKLNLQQTTKFRRDTNIYQKSNSPELNYACDYTVALYSMEQWD